MSRRRTPVPIVFTLAVAVALAAPHAFGAPSTAAVTADREAVQAAVTAYEAAEARAAEIDARLATATDRLDTTVAAEEASRTRLRTRIVAMYRTGEVDAISVLLSASSLEDFVSRWELLARIAQQGLDSLRALKVAHTAAKASAEELMALQMEQAQALGDLEAQVSRARQELAASEAALREYEARIAAAKAATPSRKTTAAQTGRPTDSTQGLTGSGVWLSAVASHYGRNFTGTGASGERIGPYSMIVAHKTLPFGTLVEVTYNGKRAVARVADRGPYTPGRDFDLGPGVVRVLDFSGVHTIKYRIVSR